MRPTDTEVLTKPRLLIVEGSDEQRFFAAYLKWLGSTDVQIISMDGKTNLTDTLRLLPATAGYKQVTSVIIVRDADDDAKKAFSSVCSSLQTAKLPQPVRPLEPTAIGSPSVTVVIMPPERASGDLEQLLLETVSDDPALPCIESFFNCLTTAGLHQPDKPDKARIQAFLASRKKHLRLLGEAADAGIWPFESATFSPLKRVLAGA